MSILGWIVFLAAALSPDQQQEIDDLNEQIRSSGQEKRRHEALATKFADRAFRFQSVAKMQDARRLYEMEQEERDIAAALQKEIDVMEKRKAQILSEAT